MKKIKFAKADVDESGYVGVYVKKIMVIDDTESEPSLHRLTFQPDEDLTAKIAFYNEQLANEGWPPIPPEVLNRINRITSSEHTAEVIRARRSFVKAEADKAKKLADEEAERAAEFERKAKAEADALAERNAAAVRKMIDDGIVEALKGKR